MLFDVAVAGKHHQAGDGVVHELTVVAYQQHRAFEFDQDIFQQLQGFDVQIIGGFVQNQHVSRLTEDFCQNCPILFSATERLRGCAHTLWCKQEVTEIADGVFSLAVDLDKVLTTTDVVDQIFVQIQLFPELVEIGNLKARAQLDLTCGRL